MDKKRYLFIDGYNLLFRMKEFDKIKSSTFPAERDVLIEILKEYAGGQDFIIYCVFDAYLTRNKEYIKEEPPISIVYTKTGETADFWIERHTRECFVNNFVDIVVVSDDNDERDVSFGYGAIVWDCHRFIKEMDDRQKNINKLSKKHNLKHIKNRNIRMSDEDRLKLQDFLNTGKKF